MRREINRGLEGETGYTPSSRKEIPVATSVLKTEGQLTLPQEVRDRLGVREGDVLEFCLDDEARVVLRPASRDHLGRLPGLLRDLAPERPVSIEEMDEAIRRRTLEKHGKARSDRH
jgi:antitoxin PrlF